MSDVGSFRRKLGYALAAALLGLSVIVHIATFLTFVSFVSLVAIAVVGLGASLCSSSFLGTPRGKLAWVAVALFVYAIALFVYGYKATGGASSVSIVDGQYFSMYKGRIIRAITQREYRMFPNLWMRALTAWSAFFAALYFAAFQSEGTSKEIDRRPNRAACDEGCCDQP